jgi:hypothetical protein
VAEPRRRDHQPLPTLAYVHRQVALRHVRRQRCRRRRPAAASSSAAPAFPPPSLALCVDDCK